MTLAEPVRPADWRPAAVKSVADVRFSSVDKKTRPGERPVRLCNYLDVYTREYIRGDETFMAATATEAEIAQFGLRQGDVLMTKDSETPDDIGIPSVIVCQQDGLVCGYHLALLRPDKSQVDPVFLAKQLKHHRLARYFGRMSNGLTRYGLPTGAVENAELWLPADVKEQERIGIVLQQIDAAIAKTERVIEKLKLIKAGLLHDLLTRGIDENGELRDPAARPELFHGVDGLGLVPRAWDVATVGDLLARNGGYIQTGPFGSQLHASEYTVAGVPVVMPQDIGPDGSVSLASVARIPARRAARLARHFLCQNDVLFARRGDLSRCTAVGAVEEGWICGTGCLLMRAPLPAIRAGWFADLYRHEICQRQIAARAVGSTMVNLNTGIVVGLTIPVPGPEEQERIEGMIYGLTARAAHEVEALGKLKLLKQGLMQDLLTGRVLIGHGSVGGSNGGEASTQ